MADAKTQNNDSGEKMQLSDFVAIYKLKASIMQKILKNNKIDYTECHEKRQYVLRIVKSMVRRYKPKRQLLIILTFCRFIVLLFILAQKCYCDQFVCCWLLGNTLI